MAMATMEALFTSVAGLSQLLGDGKKVDLIDVRTPGEFAGGHVPGAVNVPLDGLSAEAVAKVRSSAQAPLYVICKSGGRSARACKQLIEAGVGPVVNVEGGTGAWAQAGYPLQREKSGGCAFSLGVDQTARLMAGMMALVSAVLVAVHSRYWLALTAFVGVNLIQSAFTNWCPAVWFHKLGRCCSTKPAGDAAPQTQPR